MPDPSPQQLEYEFDPERDPIARRLAAIAADDAIARACLDDWRFHRASRSDVLIRAVELLAQRCAALERVQASAGRTPAQQQGHSLDEDDEG